MVDTINELSATAANYQKGIGLMRKRPEVKDEVNRMLANEILRLQLEYSRKHRFDRTLRAKKATKQP